MWSFEELHHQGKVFEILKSWNHWNPLDGNRVNPYKYNTFLFALLLRTTTTKTTTATTGDDDNDDVVNLVKSYIDAGTCDTVTTGSSCGDSANSYYAEFEYNGQRVVIVNGIPDHDAENDQFVVNPNTRCERYKMCQFKDILQQCCNEDSSKIFGWAN